MSKEPIKEINIAEDFSDVPYGRYETDGPHSGEVFRTKHLVPALGEPESPDKVAVLIDGTEGYGSTFLEEAFGGLIRKENFTLEQLRDKLEIISKSMEFELYQGLIWEFIEEAVPSKR